MIAVFSWLPWLFVVAAAQTGPTLSRNDRDITFMMLRQVEKDVRKHSSSISTLSSWRSRRWSTGRATSASR
ncbi:MAG: hypothetical protein DMF94_31110 [Acidobacteria bacterium]|nr:MAG: hypothetical protein DMF96_20745 [Acidobacteriota bacterium]PYR15714.1 MAG: hypothetical protein DMF94_31110 [Acidobacteriota bacterium]